jgi:hypothetical protein
MCGLEKPGRALTGKPVPGGDDHPGHMAHHYDRKPVRVKKSLSLPQRAVLFKAALCFVIMEKKYSIGYIWSYAQAGLNLQYRAGIIGMVCASWGMME